MTSNLPNPREPPYFRPHKEELWQVKYIWYLIWSLYDDVDYHSEFPEDADYRNSPTPSTELACASTVY